MKFSYNTAGLTLQLLLFLLVALVVLSPVAPLYEPVPARDQGVYLYIGQQILDGGVPYRDVWDHKGPLVYYINALGLWMTDSVWGVWLLEVIFLFLAAAASLLAMRTAFDPLTALSCTILWLAALPRVLDHGNSVEEYSLPFQFAAIYLFLRTLKDSKGWWNEWLIGMTAAMAFLLRPNNVGVHLSIGLVFAVMLFFQRERERAFKQIVAAASGCAFIFVIVAIYFAANRALGDLLDQLFIFNYMYSTSEAFSWQALTKGYASLTFLTPLGLAGLAGLTAHLYACWKKNGLGQNGKARFAILTLVVIPIQIYLSLMSGRKYLHYYIAWLPILALLAGFFIAWASNWLAGLFPNFRHRNVFSLLLAGGLVLAFGAKPIVNRIPHLTKLVSAAAVEGSFPQPDYSAVGQGEVVEYISKNTQPDGYVLIWGNASVYNFLAERESPSRFVYTYALGTPGYASQEIADELIANISEKRPLILDATARDGTIPGIDGDLWNDLPATQELVLFIEDNYTLVGTIGPDRFRVWVPKGK